jgi:hypothetical protein
MCWSLTGRCPYFLLDVWFSYKFDSCQCRLAVCFHVGIVKNGINGFVCPDLFGMVKIDMVPSQDIGEKFGINNNFIFAANKLDAILVASSLWSSIPFCQVTNAIFKFLLGLVSGMFSHNIKPFLLWVMSYH